MIWFSFSDMIVSEIQLLKKADTIVKTRINNLERQAQIFEEKAGLIKSRLRTEMSYKKMLESRLGLLNIFL